MEAAQQMLNTVNGKVENGGESVLRRGGMAFTLYQVHKRKGTLSDETILCFPVIMLLTL